MAKYYGKIGFGETKELESQPGVWIDEIIERFYYGDVVKNVYTTQSSETLNDNINLSNEISIVSDPYAIQNFHIMRYVEYQGVKWKVNSVEVQYPRLILSIGGLYHG